MTASIEERLAAGSLLLPTPFAFPSPNRISCVQVGDLLFVSGHPPSAEDGVPITGKVPSAVTEEEAYQCARSAARNILASIRQEIGDLDKIERVVKVFGMVNCDAGFHRQFAVIDGASDFFLELWGATAGRHARSSVGMFELPRGYPVEVEGIFQLHVP